MVPWCAFLTFEFPSVPMALLRFERHEKRLVFVDLLFPGFDSCDRETAAFHVILYCPSVTVTLVLSYCHRHTDNGDR